MLKGRSFGVVALVGTSNIRNIHREGIRSVELFRVARQRGSLTLFDPGWDPLGWSDQTVTLVRAILAETDLFLPTLTKPRRSPERENSHRCSMCSTALSGTTVIKSGASGSYFADEGLIVNVPAIPTTVDNAVGAGDVFNSGVIADIPNGSDFMASLGLASAAASIYVGRRDHRFPEYGECVELSKVAGAAPDSR